MRQEPALRWIIVALFYAGAAATAAELFLLEHTESPSQLVPFWSLAAAAAALAWGVVKPGRLSLRAIQVMMSGMVLVGAVGVYLHYVGNAAFELEMYPSMSGLELVWESLRGATPSLAPGLMSHLGLLGLAYTFRHPALRRPTDGSET